ncbi:Endoglucanase-4 [Arthrobotrys entomopaga]|nr:Endoglucanase-4 [Arthrobotrys entomopaga]
MKATLFTLLSAATSVMGHAYITDILTEDGSTYPGFDPFRAPDSRGIVQPWDTRNKNTDYPARVLDGDGMVCKRGAKGTNGVAKVQAGSKVKFRWSRWQSNHQGPIITYLAECGNSCSTAVGSQLNWFKIDEAGLLGPNNWATDLLRKQGFEWTIQLPKNIKNGNYLMRHEMIALMFGYQQNGAQIYPTCMNIEVSGGTAQTNPQGVRIQQMYTNSNPGLVVNIQGLRQYQIPGPPVSPQIGATSSTSINDGQNRNTKFSRTPVNEPTDDNGTVANAHTNYFQGGATSPQDESPKISSNQNNNQNQNQNNNQNTGNQNTNNQNTNNQNNNQITNNQNPNQNYNQNQGTGNTGTTNPDCPLEKAKKQYQNGQQTPNTNTQPNTYQNTQPSNYYQNKQPTTYQNAQPANTYQNAQQNQTPNQYQNTGTYPGYYNTNGRYYKA